MLCYVMLCYVMYVCMYVCMYVYIYYEVCAFFVFFHGDWTPPSITEVGTTYLPN